MPLPDEPTTAGNVPVRGRNVAYAHVWSARPEPVLPADLADVLYGRGFMPGITDPEGQKAALSEAGLADARFEVGSPGFRVVSLSSSRGNGCLVYVETADPADLPAETLARRTVPRPKLLYVVEAGGPSNSDRNLCENIAEALMMMTGGLVQIGGLGTKGNRPSLHASTWIGAIKAS